MVLLWRATRSLSQLTLAADEAGRGNLAPPLPSARRDEVGRLTTAFAVMLSRLRDTLAEMERSRQMAAVGAFAAQISHEIRNPLTSIKLNLQTLERGAAEGGVRTDLHGAVTISLREIRRLDRVVRGVLQLGRGRSATATTFSLGDVASSVSESLRPTFETQAITVDLAPHNGIHRVHGDRGLIDSALMNLLINAADAMPGGGMIAIRLEDLDLDGRSVTRVRVEDSGAGVTEADRERIFTPFYTTKPGGNGLGLALAYRTVEEHHGRLWVEGRADGASGAVFIMEFPRAAAS
jgi:signal transduction histidine kinase